MTFTPIQTKATNKGKIVVANASTQVLAKNHDRVYAVIVNDSDELIYLNIGDEAVYGEGIPLNPNRTGVFEINNSEFRELRAIYAISATGGKNVTFLELTSQP